MSSGVGNRPGTGAYPIEVNVDYHVIDAPEPWGSGRGKTVNISGKRITFTPEYPIPSGRCIKLSLDWPARLDQQIALKLHVTGITAPHDTGAAVVNISRHEFKIANRPAPLQMSARTAAG